MRERLSNTVFSVDGTRVSCMLNSYCFRVFTSDSPILPQDEGLSEVNVLENMQSLDNKDMSFPYSLNLQCFGILVTHCVPQ